MENVKLTKLASCAGCGAKVGAGMLSKLLGGIKTHKDERLIVGYDTSDDASVYVLSENEALVQTTDFFPPIVDDPYLFGAIAATNALSDVYAMGGEPKLALNIMCITETMDKETVQSILRGGYEKAYEAGAIITGGHTIQGPEPIYGLSVSGFVHPKKVLTNSNAKEGDVLILTKPLGVGIITTVAKADEDMVGKELMDKIYKQMSTLNKAARDIMVKYDVHSCTDVTGFSLLGHSYEMAQGSGLSIHLDSNLIPYHKEALKFAREGFVPGGMYRNRNFASAGVKLENELDERLLDIFYDPQTSGGLLIAVSEKDSKALLNELKATIPVSEIIGFVGEKKESSIYLK